MRARSITLCLRCGSPDVSGLSFDSAWKRQYLPLSGIYACQSCGYQGLPLIVDSEEDAKRYRQYLTGGEDDAGVSWERPTVQTTVPQGEMEDDGAEAEYDRMEMLFAAISLIVLLVFLSSI
jgi:hypothetical protein